MSIQEDLKKAIKAILPEVDSVIGWGQGPDALQHAPLIMRTEADVEAFEAGFFSVYNTALSLPDLKGKKVAVVARGCDSRSIVQQIAETLVKREDITIIGFPCEGVIDYRKLASLLDGKAELGDVVAVKDTGAELVVTFSAFEETIAKKDILAGICSRCMYPNAVISDTFVGEPREPAMAGDDFSDLAGFEALPLEERMAFWQQEMSRCIRCYACRNACPLCVCRDHCIAASRDPEWVTQADGVKEKLFFQVIHAVHLAGRCTGCGECQRVCPVNIPVGLFKRTMGRQTEKLFGFQAGLDPQGTPPLLTFELEERHIKERDW